MDPAPDPPQKRENTKKNVLNSGDFGGFWCEFRMILAIRIRIIVMDSDPEGYNDTDPHLWMLRHVGANVADALDKKKKSKLNPDGGFSNYEHATHRYTGVYIGLYTHIFAPPSP